MQKNKIVDLTMPIHEGMQTFPAHWHPVVEITQLGRHGIENRETRKLILGTHTGTHIDAPRHFIRNGETVENIPLDQLVGSASVLDLTDIGPRSEVSKDDLKTKLGDREAKRILLRFDWDSHLGKMSYYDDMPFLSENASKWLVDKGCRMLGMDTPMPDDPKNGYNCPIDSPNHKILLGSGIILVEYMVNLSLLNNSPDVFIVVSPMKIKQGDGAPARVFAII